MIKFTKDTDGDFIEGQIARLDHGVEDAYVMRDVAKWQVAEKQPDGKLSFVDPKEPMILPPKDKMIHGDGKLPVSKK